MTDGHGDRGEKRAVSDPGTLFDVHPDPVVCFTDDGDAVVAAVNGAFVETFDVSAATLRDRPLSAVPGAEDLDGLTDSPLRGSPVDGTVDCETAAGRSTFRVRAVECPDGPCGFLVYTPAGDAAGDAAGDPLPAEELARVASHELRNPLDSVRTRIEATVETGEIEHLDTALRNVDRVSRIIDDVTELAHGAGLTDDREPTDLTAVVGAAWRTVDAEDATLTVEDDPGRVLADSGALEHLFENLFRNSVEHGSTGNRATPDDTGRACSSEPSVADAPDDSVEHGSTNGFLTVTVGGLPDGSGFYVADDGRGIPEGERDRVFEAGYTTDREGTGLGLSIVERVAEAHGWSVAVTESHAGGARFEFTGVERPA